MIIAKFAAVVFGGYLLGSIPFGVLVSKYWARVDVRDYGSGRTGATNVLRVAGRKAAAVACFLDLLKGLLAVLFAWLIFRLDYIVVGGSNVLWLARSAQVLAALAAIAGHRWPLFLKFKGGRGVATFFGGLAGLSLPAALFGIEVLILSVFLTRYVSLGSIAGVIGAYAIMVPLTIISGFPVEYLVYTLIGSVFIIITHRDNIDRLLAGKERKFGEKVKMGSSLPSTNP